MRQRLLDATIACLAERGYAALSTNDVVRRARVSRGALAHHFPTKAELVKAAAQRLIDQRADDFRARFRAIPPQRRTPAEALEVLWAFYDDPGCAALLELNLAARHEPELKPVLAEVPGRISRLTASVVAEFFPELAELPVLDAALHAVHALYAGLALSEMAEHKATTSRNADVRDLLHLLAAALPQLVALKEDSWPSPQAPLAP